MTTMTEMLKGMVHLVSITLCTNAWRTAKASHWK